MKAADVGCSRPVTENMVKLLFQGVQRKHFAAILVSLEVLRLCYLEVSYLSFSLLIYGSIISVGCMHSFISPFQL